MGSCNGHCGAGDGLEMATPICPSLVCNPEGACGRTARGNPEVDPVVG